MRYAEVLLLCIGLATHVVYSQPIWPPWEPVKPPFYDKNCMGRSYSGCKGASQCTWHTDQSPSCWSNSFFSVKLPQRVQQSLKENPIPLVKRFFVHHFGLHLSEGSYTRHYYNTNVEECARRCLRSAGGFLDDSYVALPPAPIVPSGPANPARRCLSFDFYPFEDPIEFFPFNEAPDRGICVLNTETKDTARARNEDQGFTDAELFYKSHFSMRPFSELSGYYETRDSRGGALSEMLDYTGPSDTADPLGLVTQWGKARWGVFHPNIPGYLPKPLNATLNCSAFNLVEDVDDDPYIVDPDRAFRGGITPMDDNQHCPGLLTKSAAEELCASAGGSLCRDQSEVSLLDGRKLGCGFDNFAVWHKNRYGAKNALAYPRCCVTYEMPIVCEHYGRAQFDECARRKRNDECLKETSGTQKRHDFGFGKLLTLYRQMCRDVARRYNLPCEQLLVQRWEPRAAANGQGPCVWCPAPGVKEGGGAGECRPGGDYGVCDNSASDLKRIFGLKLRTYCIDHVNCLVAAKFPNLQPFIFPEESRSPTSPPVTVDTCFPFNGQRDNCQRRSECRWDASTELCRPTSAPTPAPTFPPGSCEAETVANDCKARPDCTWQAQTKVCEEKTGIPLEKLCAVREQSPCIVSQQCAWSGDTGTCFAVEETTAPTPQPTTPGMLECEEIPSRFGAKVVAKQCQARRDCLWRPKEKICQTIPCGALGKADCGKAGRCDWDKDKAICKELF